MLKTGPEAEHSPVESQVIVPERPVILGATNSSNQGCARDIQLATTHDGNALDGLDQDGGRVVGSPAVGGELAGGITVSSQVGGIVFESWREYPAG